jgi:hypothetical protein
MLAPDVLASVGLRACTLEEGFRGATAAIFLNDHPAHEQADIATFARTMRRPALIFDSWLRLASLRAQLPSDVTYAALGIG